MGISVTHASEFFSALFEVSMNFCSVLTGLNETDEQKDERTDGRTDDITPQKAPCGEGPHCNHLECLPLDDRQLTNKLQEETILSPRLLTPVHKCYFIGCILKQKNALVYSNIT